MFSLAQIFARGEFLNGELHAVEVAMVLMGLPRTMTFWPFVI
jgi:hypothetical protein